MTEDEGEGVRYSSSSVVLLVRREEMGGRKREGGVCECWDEGGGTDLAGGFLLVLLARFVALVAAGHGVGLWRWEGAKRVCAGWVRGGRGEGGRLAG